MTDPARDAAGPTPFRRLMANIGWLFASRGVGALLSIVYLAIATQSLGPAGFGQFAIILSTVQAIYGVISFNSWQIIVRYGAAHVVAGDSRALESLTAFLVKLEAAAALVGFALSCAVLALFATRFGWSEELRAPAMIYALIHAFSFRSTSVGLLRVHDQFRASAVADAILPITRFVGALIIIAVGLSSNVVAFLAVWALSETLTMVAMWIAVRRTHRLSAIARAPTPWSILRDRYPGLIRFALLTNIGTTFASINQHVVTLAVGLTLGEIAAGFFRLGYQLGQALAKVAEILSRAIFTEFNRLRAHGDAAALARLMRQAHYITFIVAAAIVVTLLVGGRPALLLISGPAFLPALPLMILLGTAAAVDIIGTPLEAHMLSHDGAGRVLRARVYATLVLIPAFALLIRPYGGSGAAMAVLVASLAATALFWRFSRSAPLA